MEKFKVGDKVVLDSKSRFVGYSEEKSKEYGIGEVIKVDMEDDPYKYLVRFPKFTTIYIYDEDCNHIGISTRELFFKEDELNRPRDIGCLQCS